MRIVDHLARPTETLHGGRTTSEVTFPQLMAAGRSPTSKTSNRMQAAASIILPAEVPAISGLTAITPPDRPGQTASTGDIDNHPSPLTKDLDIFPAVLPQPALPVVPVHRRRRSSKINMPAIIKRSASTPNVRGQAAADAAALSLAAEKRRNKLGYHRTSVACGMSCHVQLMLHHLTCSPRPLPAPEDQMSPCARGPYWTVFELHQAEKGV